MTLWTALIALVALGSAGTGAAAPPTLTSLVVEAPTVRTLPYGADLIVAVVAEGAVSARATVVRPDGQAETASSGSAGAGSTFRLRVDFPPGATEGGGRIASVTVTDQAGASATYDEGELAALGFPTTFEVERAYEPAPELSSFDIQTAVVDLSDPRPNVPFAIDLTADRLPLTWVGVEFESPAGTVAGTTLYEPASGDRLSGRWAGLVPLPVNADAGTWEVRVLRFRDEEGGIGRLLPADLVRLGFATTVSVVGTSVGAGADPAGRAAAPCAVPNPARGRVTLAPLAAVFDAAGRLHGTADRRGALDVAALAPGVYVTDAGCRFTVRR